MLCPGLINSFISPRLGLMRPSVSRPLSMFGSVTVFPLQGAVVVPAGHTTYVVVPCNGLRFKS